jgi:hypothetical protein
MASATHLLLRYSYPKVPGDQQWSIIDVAGPTNYTPITQGAPGPPVVPVSGGQQIFAQDFGLQALDLVVAMGSQDGLYIVDVIPVNGRPGGPITDYAVGSDFNSVLLNWVELTTVEEAPPATNLSTSRVRLLAIGR